MIVHWVLNARACECSVSASVRYYTAGQRQSAVVFLCGEILCAPEQKRNYTHSCRCGTRAMVSFRWANFSALAWSACIKYLCNCVATERR